MYRIILVDDDITEINLLKNIIPAEEYGCELIEIFDCSIDAVEYLKENEVDIILSDIKMPEITGMDIARLCYSSYPKTKVILFSGFREFDYAQQALEYGVVSYVTKPISYEALCNALKKAVEELNSINSFSFHGMDKYEKYQQIFSDILCGYIDNTQYLTEQMKELGINTDISQVQCATVNYRIDNYDDYVKSVWKHDVYLMYRAMLQLIPLKQNNVHYALIRFSKSNLEYIVISENTKVDLQECIDWLTEKIKENFKQILQLDMSLIYHKKYSSVKDLMVEPVSSTVDTALKENDVINEALKYMREHLSENVMLADVASQVFVNPKYFSRYFIKVTGKKFIDTLNDMRMEKAMYLIKNTDYSISAICSMSGYRSIPHFYDIFKKYYNDMPTSFRGEKKGD